MTVIAKFPRSEAGEIAALLGFSRSLTDLDIVERVEKGFPPKAAERVVERLDPDGSYLRIEHIIPKATYHRRIKSRQPLTKAESAQLLALAKVVVELDRLYEGNARSAALFLMRGHMLLGGRTPIEVARESTAGADLVLKLLAQGDAGVAV